MTAEDLAKALEEMNNQNKEIKKTVNTINKELNKAKIRLTVKIKIINHLSSSSLDKVNSLDKDNKVHKVNR